MTASGKDPTMIVYPDIGIRNGRCVILRRGQMSQPVVYDHDPIVKAQQFVAEGAEWLNVVDLDAQRTRSRQPCNSDLIVSLINSVPVPVQVGGGIRKIDQVDWWMEHGADCVVIGSAAYLGPGLVREACARYPFRIMLAVDVRAGRVMPNGWTAPAGITPLAFAHRFDRLDLGGILVTDVDYDTEMAEASFALVADMARRLHTPVIASGMVKSLDDLSTLRHLGTVAGAVIGRPLHEGAMTLDEALRLLWEVDPAEAWWRKPPRDVDLPEEPRLRDRAAVAAAVEIVRAATMAQAPGKRPMPAPRGQGGDAGKGERSPERGFHQG